MREQPVPTAAPFTMLLAIDVGNTNITFAVFDGEQVKADWRIGTVARRTGDEYAASADQPVW